jgi:hypothetical protein
VAEPVRVVAPQTEPLQGDVERPPHDALEEPVPLAGNEPLAGLPAGGRGIKTGRAASGTVIVRREY